MNMKYELKPLQGSDHLVVREVYEDAIKHQIEGCYTQEQIQAWASLAWLPGVLDRSLLEGKGWISLENQQVEAFAVRYPLTRLALLYCRGRSAGRGHATALLDRVESEACEEGQAFLVTEASLFSYSLLSQRGWMLIAPETMQIGGVNFERFRMQKFF